MQRRQFIRAASVCLLLPATISPGLSSMGTQRRSYGFFDDRFPNARRFAAAWPGSVAAVAVQGDVTTFWQEGLERLVGTQPLRLHGVTTESFRFCLHTLMREHAGVETLVSRLDRNLLVWTMTTTPNANAGIHHG
jgi:hypothetical protein